MPYIRRGEKATPWVPWADWFNSDQEGGQRRHKTRLKTDKQRVSRALSMQPGRRVIYTIRRIDPKNRVEIHGVLVRVYPYIVPGVVVCVIRSDAGKIIKAEASLVRYEVKPP